MIRVINAHDIILDEIKYAEYAGKSTDTKPTKFTTKTVSENGRRVLKDIGIATGSLFLEVDTGDVYAYDEIDEEWDQIAALGGGS